MKTQQQLHTIRNRSRRIPRRIRELTHEKDAEVMIASRNNREPDIAPFINQINRLTERQAQLA